MTRQPCILALELGAPLVAVADAVARPEYVVLRRVIGDRKTDPLPPRHGIVGDHAVGADDLDTAEFVDPGVVGNDVPADRAVVAAADAQPVIEAIVFYDRPFTVAPHLDTQAFAARPRNRIAANDQVVGAIVPEYPSASRAADLVAEHLVARRSPGHADTPAEFGADADVLQVAVGDDAVGHAVIPRRIIPGKVYSMRAESHPLGQIPYGQMIEIQRPGAMGKDSLDSVRVVAAVEGQMADFDAFAFRQIEHGAGSAAGKTQDRLFLASASESSLRVGANTILEFVGPGGQKHFITRSGSGNSRRNGPAVLCFHGDRSRVAPCPERHECRQDRHACEK